MTIALFLDIIFISITLFIYGTMDDSQFPLVAGPQIQSLLIHQSVLKSKLEGWRVLTDFETANSHEITETELGW